MVGEGCRRQCCQSGLENGGNHGGKSQIMGELRSSSKLNLKVMGGSPPIPPPAYGRGNFDNTGGETRIEAQSRAKSVKCQAVLITFIIEFIK